VPGVNAFGLPLRFNRPEQALRLRDGHISQQLEQRMAKAGFICLGCWDNGIRHFSNCVRPLHGPADFAGLRIRTPADPVAMDIVRALGAQPVEIRFSALYQALQRRTVDGQENPLLNIWAARLHEVQTHISLTAHKYEITPFVMSLTAWQALSGTDREIVQRAADEATRLQRTLTRSAEEDARQALMATGVHFTPVNRQPFVKATRPIHDKWLSGPSGAYVRQVVEAAAR
ncbi:MAG TPA: TRAP transporter substrate-binding protein, partial [Zoogloea sp.]|nr:TRAP transporter substrate-binding protein [Zoogloea sp.]